jgi:hypothetical protein
VPTVYILKDPSGMLRVQVPAQKEPGAPSVTRKGVEGGGLAAGVSLHGSMC